MLSLLTPRSLATSAAHLACLTWATCAMAQSVDTSQLTYTESQTVQLNWTGAATTTDWLAIYPAGVTPGSVASTRWNYLNGTQTAPTSIIASGTAAMPPALPVGNYSAYLLASNGYSIRASKNFSVVAAATTGTVTAPTTVAGETMVVNFTGAPGNQTDWIAVYPQGQTGTNYVTWAYVGGAAAGSVTFNGLAAGNYDIYLYANNSYTVVAQGATTVNVNALKVTNPVFSDNESAGFSYNYADTQNNHWIGLYAPGAANQNFLWSTDVGGADFGSGTAAYTLIPGNYELRSFKSGTYEKVGVTSFVVRDDHRQTNWVSLPGTGQTHAVGSAGTINGYADPVWKAGASTTGVLSSTTATRMKAGSYQGMVQIIHSIAQVKAIGRIEAVVNGQVIAQKTISSNPIPKLGSYDCLYESLPFSITSESDVTFRVIAGGKGAFSTGAMSIFNTTQKRPFHVIAHRKNNIQRVNTAVSQGATGVEIDTTPVDVNGELRIEAHHHNNEVDWTPYTGYDALLATVKGHMDSGALTVVYCDIKDTLPGQTYTQFATELYTRLMAQNIDPKRVVVGTFEPETFQLVAVSMGYPVNIDSYYWGGTRPAGWIADAEKYSTLQEFGQPEASTTDTQALTSAIYTSGKIKTCYIWTFTNDTTYIDNTFVPYTTEYSKTLARRMMILGVNGVMPDECSSMGQIVNEPAFQGIFRKATTTDFVSDLHGEN